MKGNCNGDGRVKQVAVAVAVAFAVEAAAALISLALTNRFEDNQIEVRTADYGLSQAINFHNLTKIAHNFK